ncbi:lecithin retinol acyltransferase family protein [Vibrio vulnificus]|uniref:lecithin retinol acyltransferase family protein n=1 Tax=Vibrio vulnificus TaxID=672 RepID=UPI000DAE65D3|nr:lecithin retinol acyltransferase family protein [Vibrio vulnificus]EIF8196617.1 lecithin retinol acyltransferase family protein [Vibrio vulnificus]EJV9314190.1 lecithin retinol acyltransferase family protein [Vibrio vulnificus]ELA3113549.1 lecithin retinol acyltransferase family protein [Vibrio vulnificus]ELB7531435.1 lecithin retinol acyltransferase family protein [Vibrio vulnificus]ELH3008437.1 lecithin retinol acyltransferase family protein [Vibrio vulnificus]
MDLSLINPGDVIVSRFTFGPVPYQHWALASDRRCPKGYCYLISASDRTGTVKEEPAEDVIQGAPSYKADIVFKNSIPEVIAQARGQIDRWKYSVNDRNCEQFVNWAAGLGITSKQVINGTALGVLGGTATALMSEKPTWLKILGVGVACFALGVANTKAPEKK